ncbi:DUF3466 family protein [Psychrosphaera ytuae]|uniref:DUF3466 family protein n=1 Tax=Psychrosphaera ytuae TaxID=2820710 RepID=UPI001E553A73|nr:DUF3466 family protein [Psychrosphaera ytuae]
MKFAKSTIALSLMLSFGYANAATYEIKEIPNVKDHRQQFSTALNNVGEVVGIARSSVNFPFYFENYITNASASIRANCGISDAEISAGQLDASSASCLKSTLSNTSGNFVDSPSYQKIGDVVSFKYSAGETTQTTLTDVFVEELNSLSRSTVEQLNDINNLGFAAGTASAPYRKISFQQTGENASESPITLFERDFTSRATVINNGNVLTIAPKEVTFGGVSAATSITDNNFVSGYQSVSVREVAQTTIENDCKGESLPENVCAWSLAQNLSLYDLRPVVWSIDNEGNVLEKSEYPLAFTPKENQNGNYVAYASAVNEMGVAVGYGDAPATDNDNVILKFPLLFKDGTTIQILEDNRDYDGGYATDINNQGLVVGHLQKFVDRQYNDEFFVYDINTGEIKTPTTFYKSAQSQAAAINDNGYVVGVAEYELTTSQIRRKHGFLYDLNTDQVLDLNDLTECQSKYEIVEVSDINNNNQISATAIKTVNVVNALGEPVLDDNGNNVTTTQPVAVLLEPISGGQIDDCGELEEPSYERQGMSTSIWLLATLSFFAVIRRRFI